MTTRLLVGDVFERMAELPDHSFDLIVTSPPFLALRSYLPEDHPQKDLEIGSESTPAEYLDVLLQLSAEWRRLLAPHGSIAIELGDVYAGSGGAGGDYGEDGLREGQAKFDGSGRKHRRAEGRTAWEREHPIQQARDHVIPSKGPGWPLDKSLTGIPTLYTWSLAYGRNLLTGAPSPAGRWRIRNLKPWIRSNPPVGALGDKERPATSYITVACTGTSRWFDLDAVRTPLAPGSERPRSYKAGSKTDQEHGRATVNNSDGQMSNPGGAPPKDWFHPVDAVIDAVIDQRPEANEWTKKSLPNSTSSPPKDAGGATATTLAASSGSSETVTTPCESSAANTPATSGAAVPTSRQIDAVIDAVIDQRAGKPSRWGGAGSGKGGHSRDRGRGIEDAEQWTSGASTVGARGARGVHIRRALTEAGYLTNGDYYDVSPKGYAGAHYAVWPPELVRLLVDEMCPRFVCPHCGPMKSLESDGAGDRSCPTCGETVRLGRVLDPFVGSGTTLAVASGMGRDSVGIDLDQASYGLTQGRVGPLVWAMQFDISWPASNWDAPVLPRADGDYSPWEHMLGEAGRLAAEEPAEDEGGPWWLDPQQRDQMAARYERRNNRRPIVDVPGQGGLFEEATT